MITITMNLQKLEVPENTSLQQVLENSRTPSSGIAVAINEQIIPKSEWSSQLLKNNDQLLVIQAVQGG
ncbi:sulfur carrier protein ThiS [Euzebyella saccharophila]|uniref:Sulfur carrier protein ThiS n=1 Tax=Euzebyella saccharophila TaxID=679664 RepID=A0ABV8JVD4_9FLAO|nr:sulfur carrier protein ThiS [Euzebyella saccharophila]